MRNALSLYLRKDLLTLEQAFRITYDGEFVALAKRLDTKLVTSDKKVLNAFPKIAVSLVDASA